MLGHRNFGLWPSAIGIDLCVAWCCAFLRRVAWHARSIARSIQLLRSVAYGCASYTDVDAVGQGKMWDCKTSKMSQSPRAALNAFGLFASGLLGEQGHTCSQGGGRHFFGAVRHLTAARAM